MVPVPFVRDSLNMAAAFSEASSQSPGTFCIPASHSCTLPSKTWSSVWDEYRGRDLFLGHPCLNLLDNGIFLHPSHLYIGVKSC